MNNRPMYKNRSKEQSKDKNQNKTFDFVKNKFLDKELSRPHNFPKLEVNKHSNTMLAPLVSMPKSKEIHSKR